MELKHLITHFTYRIEPKPEGGFIAHATDPAVQPIEAPTREELQQKIQANIASGLAAEFPSLKLPLENQELKFAFHIERPPGGGFAIHSADPNIQPFEGATHEEIERHFAERLIAFAGKHFMPELSQALAAQGNSGDIKVFVKRTKGVTVNAGSDKSSLGIARDPAGSSEPDDTNITNIEDVKLGDPKAANANFGRVGDVIGNSTITPGTSSSWTIVRFLLTLLIITALMYFFLRHR
jgi:hypothetical protein